MKRRERVNKEQVTAKICNNLFFHTGLETNIHFKKAAGKWQGEV